MAMPLEYQLLGGDDIYCSSLFSNEQYLYMKLLQSRRKETENRKQTTIHSNMIVRVRMYVDK